MARKAFRVLGVDPGLAIVGYAVVEVDGTALTLVACGVITTPAQLPSPARLQLVFQGLSEIAFEFRPRAAVVETFFFGKNVSTALHVAQARGVSLLALIQAGVPISEYSPQKVKYVVVGSRSATKREVGEEVCRQLHLAELPRPDDATDAAAIALCHLKLGQDPAPLRPRKRPPRPATGKR